MVPEEVKNGGNGYNESRNVGSEEENRLIKQVSSNLREKQLEFLEEKKLIICEKSEKGFKILSDTYIRKLDRLINGLK